MRKIFLGLALVVPMQAFTIRVDYRFDTEGFFETPGAKDALEAAAARWSRIIDQELLAVDIRDEARSDIRFQLVHPGNGDKIQLSAAAGPGSDVAVQFERPAADVYLGGFSLEENVWILYAGGYALEGLGEGGPIQLGANDPKVAEDPNSLVNRGFNSGSDSLSVLGGTVSFDINTKWSFDLYEPGVSSELDFYTIALHEIGHGLGLSAQNGPEWRKFSSTGSYVGPLAVAAYNSDNQADLAGLNIESLAARNFHWKDNTYDSFVFQLGKPDRNGVVGAGVLQDLLMEPGVIFTALRPRLEVTNVEVGALRDIGWSVITENPPPEPALQVGIERSAEGAIKLTIPSEEQRTYTIQTSTNGVNWLSVRPFLIGDGSLLNWEDGQEGFTDPYGNAVDLAGKFYRVNEN